MATRKSMTGGETLRKLRGEGAGTTRAKGTARSRASATDRLRELYRSVKEHRFAKEAAEQGAKSATRDAVALATEHDMREDAITFEFDGMMFVGSIISPKGSDKWDLEKVVEFAHKKGIWDYVSTRVFDQEKWEAEVASGNVRPSDASKLRIPGTPGTPYVKIDKK